MGNVSYYTPEGYAKLKAELEHMKTVERAHVIKQIAEARDKGDLSENAEYDAAKKPWPAPGWWMLRSWTTRRC